MQYGLEIFQKKHSQRIIFRGASGLNRTILGRGEKKNLPARGRQVQFRLLKAITWLRRPEQRQQQERQRRQQHRPSSWTWT